MSDQETDKPTLNNVLRQLDIKHLMAFEAIYSTRNISRAGQSLKFSQPTMSNLLARLRTTLDDPLFLRQPRGVLPSRRAEELIGPIRRVLREIERIAQPATSFDPERDTREFRLHALDIFESILIPPLVRRVQGHKGVTFKLLLPAKFPILEALESGEADLALGVSPHNQPDLRWEDLTPTELYVIARKGHPRIDGTVTLADLQECSHAVMDMSPGALANSHLFSLANRLERHDAVRVTRPSSVIEIVANTDLVGFANRIQVALSPYRDQLQVLPPPREASSQHFRMTWHHRNDADPGLVWLRGEIRAIMAEVKEELEL